MRFPSLRVTGLLMLLLAAGSVRAAEETEPFELAEGLEVSVWARTPQLFNPTNIDVDARGRIWVTEGVNYRETWKDQNALLHPDGDRVVILEDTDGDGVADSSKMFVQDKDLICPLGIAVIGDKVIVSCSPHLIVYTDANGDDVPDKREILLTGFGGFDHDHGLHSLVGHLDGRWYFNVGNDGPHEVTDKSGWTLSSGSCYRYGPNDQNTGNRKSDDGRVWTGGVALRVDPDGKNLTPLGHNFRNSYEIALDSFGDRWQNDNDDDGNRSCRTGWVMEGANLGYFSADGTRTWKADVRPGQETQIAHWHQDDPGVIPAGDFTGAGGPTGVVVYENGLLPAAFQGAIFNCDAGRNRVWMHKPIADGAGFKYERSVLIAARETDQSASQTDQETEQPNWFRPSDVAVGTDGAIYVSDWFDPVVGGHNIREKKGGGRILRIAPRGVKPKLPTIELSTVEGAIAALNSPAINIRHQAAVKLPSFGEQAVAALLPLLEKDGVERARAIWVLARCGQPGMEAVERMLRDGDAQSRLVAFRALRGMDHGLLEHANALASDSSPAVRREVAIALRDVPLERSRDAILKLAQGYDGKDRFYLEALGIACERKEEALYTILIEKLGQTDPLKWSDAMAGIVWRLHPLASLDALAKRAGAAGLSTGQRRQAGDAIAFINHERAAEAMAQLANEGPEDVRPLAEWWITNRETNDWKDYTAARHFASQHAPPKPDEAALARLAKDREMMLDKSATKRNRDRAAARLAADPEGAKYILSLASEGKFPQQLANAVTEPLYRNEDLGVRGLASQFFPRKAAGGVPLPPVKQLATVKGDAARGRIVFFGNTAGCAKCHTFAGEGRDVGPDLTAIRTKFGRPELLDSILNPSGSIAFGYEPWIVKTKKNQVYSGFIVADGESVVIKESSGQQVTIPAGEIVLRKKQTMSVMPDNVAMGLTAQEIADVAEFLLASPVKQSN